MRRILTLSAILTLFAATPAFAVFSFGVHGGFDLNGGDAHEIAGETLSDGTSFEIERNAIDAPLMGGIHFRIDAFPVLDLEIGVEASFRQYGVVYSYDDGGTLETFDDDAFFGRIGGYASLKYNVIDLPMVKGYAGGGLGYHVVAPLVSRELLEKLIVEDNLDSDEMDPAEILGKEGAVGGHLLAGVSFKPSFVPLTLSVEGRYYLLQENDYADETNRFLGIAFGLDLGF